MADEAYVSNLEQVCASIMEFAPKKKDIIRLTSMGRIILRGHRTTCRNSVLARGGS